jgi:hypothetical protein
VIDQSDYYLLISAGRYGSIHPETGLSYTEMEYDYAMEIGKPVIRLLYRDPFNELQGERIEQSGAGRRLLKRFREKISSGSLVRFWSDPSELGAETVFALRDVIRRAPATGWTKNKNSRAGVHIASKEKIQNSVGVHVGPVRDKQVETSAYMQTY